MRLFVLFFLLLLPLRAAAGVFSGVAEWTYAEYASEVDGSTALEASHLTQRYSLLYRDGRAILGGRGGYYKYGLGLEWTSLDAELNDQDIDIRNLKLLYEGDVLLAPGGLPFRLHLYSRDLQPAYFVEDAFGLPAGTASFPILRPDIVTDIQNGVHRETGATLLVGIRNGSYMGGYRDILSRFPRLMMDYREYYVKDEESRSPQHYRSRQLAFVSLNKKDNWFHFRYTDYTDYLNENENYVEKQFILGTIDPYLRRQWVNFTNWIRISVDGSLTQTTRTDNLKAPEINRHDLHLFGTARRRGWEASTFTTFSRIVEEDFQREKELEVPLFASGRIGRETSWRYQLVGTRYEQERFDLALDEELDDLFSALRVETNQTGRYIVALDFDAESKTGTQGEGYGARAGFEVYSNRLHLPRTDLFGSYHLLYLAGEGESGTDVDYWEHQLAGRAERNLSARVRTGIGEEIIFGSGTIDHTVADHLFPKGTLEIDEDPVLKRTIREGETFRSITSWFIEHRSQRRIDNRLTLIYDYLDPGEGEDQDLFRARHSLVFRGRQLRVNWRSELTVGNQDIRVLSGVDGEKNAGGELGGIGGIDESFYSEFLLDYLPSRNWENSLLGRYQWFGGGGTEDGSQWYGRQRWRYNFYQANGFVRKVAGLYEELEYERFETGNSQRRTIFSLLVGGDYFPTRHLLLGGRIEYNRYSPEDFDELIYSLSAGMNFDLLQLALSYAYGDRSAGSSTLEQNDHRWEVRLRKIF